MVAKTTALPIPFQSLRRLWGRRARALNTISTLAPRTPSSTTPAITTARRPQVMRGGACWRSSTKRWVGPKPRVGVRLVSKRIGKAPRSAAVPYNLPIDIKYLRVGLPGLEPGTSSLSEKRSNRLSYRPVHGVGIRRRVNVQHGGVPDKLIEDRRGGK